MNRTLIFVRTLFFLFAVGTAIATLPQGWLTAFSTGLGLLALLAVGEVVARKQTLKAFNTITLGLFFGLLMSLALLAFISPLFDFPLLRIAIFVGCTYAALLLTIRHADTLHLSLPFLHLEKSSSQGQAILLDLSALNDGRIIDLASTGLLDGRLIIPRSLIGALKKWEKSPSTDTAGKAKRTLEILRKLEGIPKIGLTYHEGEQEKPLELARQLGAAVLTAEQDRLDQPTVEGVRFINIHSLANALKPLMERGEFLNIKIQRVGKEDRQGVGYLDDGTMVVVNGAGDCIGDMVKSRVLSVKHSSTGRMVFCNLEEDDGFL